MSTKNVEKVCILRVTVVIGNLRVHFLACLPSCGRNTSTTALQKSRNENVKYENLQ